MALSLSATAKYVPDVLRPMSLSAIAQSAIEYSLLDQVSTADKLYLAGEFRTKIQSTLIPSLVGVGKAFGNNDEATAFTTSAVVNQMAQLYLDNPGLQSSPAFSKIPMSMSKAVQTYSKYQSGETFNFYPSRTLEDGTVVRRPVNMKLFPIWHGFTNIPNDSDTSSSVLLSLVYNSKINNTGYEVPQAAVDEISSQLDQNRNPMYYNRLEKRKNTGAFMTWLMNEKAPEMPRFFFARSKEGARIPFNKNDVDCVVNANVIKLLQASGRSSGGYDAACSMINDMVKKNEGSSCGIYYPNTYNLGAALAGASKLGNKCLLEENKNKILKRILAEQNADGSWTNIHNIWTDEVLSTAFALSTLLEFGDFQNEQIRTAVLSGVRSLLMRAKMHDGIIYWDADHFFTATAIARSLIMWKSKAYTNLIIAGILLKVEQNSPGFKAEALL